MYCHPMPSHIVDLEEVLRSDVFKERLSYKIGKNGQRYMMKVVGVIDSMDFSHVIFYCPEFVEEVLRISPTTGSVDGTYKTVPWLTGAHQLLIVSAFSFQKVQILMCYHLSSIKFLNQPNANIITA